MHSSPIPRPPIDSVLCMAVRGRHQRRFAAPRAILRAPLCGRPCNTWLYGPGPCLQSVTGGSGGRHPGKPAYGPGRHHLHTAAPSSSVRFRSLERTPALALNPCPAAHACMPPSHPLPCVVLHASPTLAALLRELTGCSLIHCRRLRHSSRARVDGARRVERSTSTRGRTRGCTLSHAARAARVGSGPFMALRA